MRISMMGGIALIALAAPTLARETRAQGTPAATGQSDSLYKIAREALSDGNYSHAAQLFRQVATKYPAAAIAPDALYWEAFAYYRDGDTDDLHNAQRALASLKSQYPQSKRLSDATSLSTRVCGELARQGDEGCAAQIAAKAAWAANTRTATAAIAASAAADGNTSMRAAIAEARMSAAASAEEAKAALDVARSYAPYSAMSMSGSRHSVSDACPREEDDDRVAALNALLQMDAASAEPLLEKVLARRDACSAGLRRKAVFLVSQKQSPQAIDVLLNVAKTDPEPEVREQAVFWLSQVPSERAVVVLNDILMKSTDNGIRDKALFAISQNRSPQASQILRDYASNASQPSSLRERAIFWIGQSRGSENSAFLRTLYSKLTDENLKEKTLTSLAMRKDSDNAAWMLTIAQSRSESLEMRKKALFWAGQAGVTTEQLVRMYDGLPVDDLREQMIFVLSQRKDAAATDKLFSIARSDKDVDARKRAIFWLGQSHDPRAVQLLSELIEK